MGATAAAHPSDPILQAYGLGKLDDVSSASVSKHLEGSDPCQRRVAELSSNEFLGRLQKVGVMLDKATSGWSPSDASLTDGAPRSAVSPPPVDTLPPELVDHPDYEKVATWRRSSSLMDLCESLTPAISFIRRPSACSTPSRTTWFTATSNRPI